MSTKSKPSVIEGYVNDITKAFENIYQRKPAEHDSLLMNKTLFNILDSYFFKELYNYKKMGIDNNGHYRLKSISNGFLDEEILKKTGDINAIVVPINQYQKKVNGINNYKMPEPKDIDINYYSYFLDALKFNNKDSVLKEVDIPSHPDESLMMQNLIEQSPLYSILFETNSLKKQLYLKQKDMLTLTIVPELEALEFIKNHITTQKLKNEDYMDYLKHNYDLRYCSNDSSGKPSNNFYVFAHNNFELAGVTVIRESETVANVVKNEANKFMTVTSVMVAKGFRGQSLGVKMFEEVLKESEAKDYIVIRTGSSENGRNYLKDNITEKSKEYSVPVIQSEAFDHIKNNLNSLFDKRSYASGKEMLVKVLMEITEFQEEIKIEKKNARSSDEFYDIADKEEEFYKNLKKKLTTGQVKPKF